MTLQDTRTRSGRSRSRARGMSEPTRTRRRPPLVPPRRTHGGRHTGGPVPAAVARDSASVADAQCAQQRRTAVPARAVGRGALGQRRSTGTSAPRAGATADLIPVPRRGTDASARGHASAALVQPGERLFQQCVAVGVAAPLAHVGQMRLVRLGARRRRRVLLVLPGRQSAARAVPVLRDVGVAGEGDPRLVPVRAPERDAVARRSLAPFGLTHRTCSDPGAPNRVATSHERPLIDTVQVVRQLTAARAV